MSTIANANPVTFSTSPAAPATEYVILEASAKMPSSCKGRYARIAVCEVVAGTRPKMISERARGMVRIVATWERVHVGGERSAYAVAMRDAQEYVAKLQAAR